jgi:hypothetical protein
MPSLLLFAPCERVALDQKDNSPSLINVFQGFNVTLLEHSPEAPIPGDAVLVTGKALPFRWVVFALWRKVASDEGKSFEQICELISPSGRESFTAKLAFKMEHSFHRICVNVARFPIDENGEYSLKLYLRESEGQAQLQATYQISVTQIAGDEDESTPNN